MATETSQKETALATFGGFAVDEIIPRKLYRDRKFREHFNVLFSESVFEMVPPIYRPMIGMVVIDLSGETYAIPGSQDRGLSKVAISKIGNERGLSFEAPIQVSPHSDVNNYEFCSFALGRAYDGNFQRVPGTAHWHWEVALDKNERIGIKKGEKDPKAYALRRTREERDYAAERTATRSMLSAARFFCSLKTSYTVEEVKKPFLVAKLVPNTDDPAIHAAMVQNAVLGVQMLYPAAPLPAELVAALPVEVAPDLPNGDENQEEPQATTDPQNPEPQATDAPPPVDEQVPVDAETSEGEPLSLVHPTPAEQRQAEKREIIEDLNASAAGGQLDKATLRDIIRDVLGLRNGQATPHLSLLDLPSLRSVRARAREAKARA